MIRKADHPTVVYAALALSEGLKLADSPLQATGVVKITNAQCIGAVPVEGYNNFIDRVMLSVEIGGTQVDAAGQVAFCRPLGAVEPRDAELVVYHNGVQVATVRCDFINGTPHHPHITPYL